MTTLPAPFQPPKPSPIDLHTMRWWLSGKIAEARRGGAANATNPRVSGPSIRIDEADLAVMDAIDGLLDKIDLHKDAVRAVLKSQGRRK